MTKVKEAAILMGGRASRMEGRPKYALRDVKGATYLQRQMAVLRDFEQVYLSAARQEQLDAAMQLLYSEMGEQQRAAMDEAMLRIPGIKPAVTGCLDAAANAGPMGGLYTILGKMRGEWSFVTACDMPSLTPALLSRLADHLDESVDCVVCQDRRKRLHPLCAYYRKTLLPLAEEMLSQQDYRMEHLLIRARCKVVGAKELGVPDAALDNVNTPEEYRKHRGCAACLPGEDAAAASRKVLAVCGVKNSGKTTYIERLVRELTARGQKVAVIKHDGHDFEGDRPGTDTYRYHEAGAAGTAIFSSSRYMVNKDETVSIENLMEAFRAYDVLLIEGMKNSTLPKIELVRRGIGDRLSCNKIGLAAVVTDVDGDFDGIETWSFDDLEACIRWLNL